jgi:hypothetical protein
MKMGKADLTLKEQFSRAFHQWAQEGIDRMSAQSPTLSHICFKFTDAASYAAGVEAARDLGKVTQEQFKGKEITWCHLRAPLKQDGLTLEWLELVEPKSEPAATNGVSSIGYAIPGMKEAVKIPSKDGNVIFRYQSQHAAGLAPK